MKKVIITEEPPTNVVDVSKASTNKFYLAEFGRNNIGIIIRHSKDYFAPVTAYSGFTNGETYYAFQGDSLFECIRLCIRNGASVHEFDTFKEMAKWIIENTD